MDKFHLAYLISFVQQIAYNQRVFEADDIAQIDKIICNGMPQQPMVFSMDGVNQCTHYM